MNTNRVLATYFTVAGLYTLAAALIWGVNTLFLLDAGLDIFQVFVANAAFTAGSVLFEIPTGVFADSRGRRISFLLSVSILLLTTLAYVGVAELGGDGACPAGNLGGCPRRRRCAFDHCVQQPGADPRRPDQT